MPFQVEAEVEAIKAARSRTTALDRKVEEIKARFPLPSPLPE